MGLRSSAIFSVILCISLPVFAGVSLNAGCELEAQKPLIGTHADDSFVIASLSKIFTTNWALQKIGPHFQYETVITIEAVSSTVSNIHISGDADPTWGREMLHYLASELDRLGVRKIKTLSFDENFLLAWRAKANVIDKKNYYYDFTDLAGGETFVPTPESIESSLVRNFIPRSSEYKVTLENAKLANMELVEKLQISAPSKVKFISTSQYQPPAAAKSFTLRSLPLYKILKLMNVTSNNYLADILFLQLGGIASFQKFLETSPLAPFASAIDMQNGSGFPIKNGQSKFYNRSSCAGVVHALHEIDKTMVLHNMGLEFVFPVATSDKSTLDKYELPADIMIAKTGTVNPTITLAGMILTKDGPLYFSQLIKTDSAKDWMDARALIKDYLLDLIETQATPLGYAPALPTFWGEGNGVSLPNH